MVGSVLVHNDRIIGEGWHRQYGQAHAEVNCIRSVAGEDRHLISSSTIYVSLEPCAHWGRTPPCADLIIEHKIPRVVLGCTDTFSEVSGKGMEKLWQAGIDVITGVLEQECRWLNRRFFTRQERHRPYIILKWAESADGFIAPEQGRRVMLSNAFSQKLVHKMRSEEDGILVGYNTALLDNPQLNNRSGSGRQPLRMVIDPELQLPQDLQLFDRQQPTLVFNYHQEEELENLHRIKISKEQPLAPQVIAKAGKINSLIIEGGSKTLQQFIDAGLWDEAIIYQTPHRLEQGTRIPVLHQAVLHERYSLDNDVVNHYYHEHTAKLYPVQ
jgi:diaminohydroxyphosphoribosylaminopyrimidine deaminase/5-amino-6-(5-phosphoribosylamino)uracil reductase